MQTTNGPFGPHSLVLHIFLANCRLQAPDGAAAADAIRIFSTIDPAPPKARPFCAPARNAEYSLQTGLGVVPGLGFHHGILVGQLQAYGTRCAPGIIAISQKLATYGGPVLAFNLLLESRGEFSKPSCVDRHGVFSSIKL